MLVARAPVTEPEAPERNWEQLKMTKACVVAGHVIAVVALLTSAVLAMAATAQPLPRVFVVYGVGGETLVKTTVRPHGQSYNSCPAPLVYLGGQCYKRVPEPFDQVYKLRPSSITVSADGDEDLSSIDWTSWGNVQAGGSGLQFVRCWPSLSRVKAHPGTGGWPLPPGMPYARCPGGSGAEDSFDQPVTIRLSVPVETAHGPVFTMLTTSWHSFELVLPPAS
jgi:hypothetical protein